jgi:S-DNA-T family DNA segregation ATPase FtsK/SpoIIIE
MLVFALVLRLWARTRPASFERWLTGPLRRRARRRWLSRNWTTVAASCGLGVSRRARSLIDPIPRLRLRAVVDAPRIDHLRSDGPQVRLRLRLLMGQTLEDVEKAADRLRTAVGASRVRVDPAGTGALVTFTFGDPLATAFGARLPHPEHCDNAPQAVRMGKREDGSDWWLPVGPHTLVAGCSGAGKGSVFWSYAFGLAPAVRAGTARLFGIDLKGGMEVLMGSGLFTSHAVDAGEAVVVLEDLVAQMKARTRKYAGQVRSHRATVGEPLCVVMIDELAALTAYSADRALQRRAEAALSMLCSQGRAPGFVVFACLQDPRKEVIPARGLFTQMIGLRLRDQTEAAMVLGDGAVATGAACHRIPPSTPGVGYVVPEEGGYPIRVRAGFASDEAIRTVARDFATPVQMPVVIPKEAASSPSSADRGSRRRDRRGAA